MNLAGNPMDREIPIFRLFPGASFRGAATAATAAATAAVEAAAAAAAVAAAAAGIGSGFKFLLSSKRARAGVAGPLCAAREEGCSEKIGREESSTKGATRRGGGWRWLC